MTFALQDENHDYNPINSKSIVTSEKIIDNPITLVEEHDFIGGDLTKTYKQVSVPYGYLNLHPECWTWCQNILNKSKTNNILQSKSDFNFNVSSGSLPINEINKKLTNNYGINLVNSGSHPYLLSNDKMLRLSSLIHSDTRNILKDSQNGPLYKDKNGNLENCVVMLDSSQKNDLGEPMSIKISGVSCYTGANEIKTLTPTS